jgi:very-short-patch-repair endonuclease
MEDTPMTTGIITSQFVKELKKERAQDLRRTMTPAENIFWQRVRNRQIAKLKFRRQQVIYGYIVDFYCEELRLCVEIDGPIHGRPRQKLIDRKKDAVLQAIGLRVLRFTNEDVLERMEWVAEKITGLKEGTE